MHTNHITLVENQGWDERILVCRNAPLVDTFIIITTRYVVMVDTLFNPATATQLVDFARPYLTQDRTLLVINTHADYDHSWGNQIFAGAAPAYPAPIVGSRECAWLLQSEEAAAELRAYQEREPAIFGEVVLTPPTIAFDHALRIDGGDLTLELLAAPGHTPDHIAIYIPEIRTLLAGDAAELPYPLVNHPADLPLLRQTLAHLAALNPTVALYCHAPVTMGPELLRENLAYFDRVEQACLQSFRRGVSAAQLISNQDDAAVIQLVDLPLSAALPADTRWQPHLSPNWQVGHAEHIRTMAAWLSG
jgi:glyoxylase-like metal-dependent hydrolase (beta-lactamase superfamily II)